ncbi:helix-turn-helix transcriptional regulator [Xanthobacter variabilis]|uniref:helix-turn-helix transcriptional regulator n=1 Tax=Xanthobacter variabilis TaxID=3119932 RepID=UPI00374E2454
MLTFSDVLYRIYEATLSPERWDGAMDAIAALSGSTGALVYARKPSGSWDIATFSPRLSDAVRIYTDEGWWQHNPWLDQSIEIAFQAGDVYCDKDILGEARIEEQPFYAQFLPRVGLGWQMAAVIHADLGAPTGLVVQRAKTKGPYAAEEMETLRLVSRHLEQSLRISSRFAAQRTAGHSATAAFDSMDRAAFVLDEQQRPLLMNQTARKLIGSYFNHAEGRVTPAQRTDHEAFATALQRAREGFAEQGGAPQPTTVSGPEGASPLVVWTLPMVGASAHHLSDGEHRGHVLVLAQPLEQDRVIDPSVLRNAFELTLGEARLAALLGAGSTLKDAAQELHITEGTARVVLKRVFQKLNISRQAELVAKLSAFTHSAA